MPSKNPIVMLGEVAPIEKTDWKLTGYSAGALAIVVVAFVAAIKNAGSK